MPTPFNRAFRGYRADEVDACIEQWEKRCQSVMEYADARVQEVAEENIRLAVDLKVAQAGYCDAAELLMTAQAKNRELEKMLVQERAHVLALKEEMARLAPRLEEIERENEQIRARLANTQFENISYDPPAGVFPETNAEAEGARDVMLRLFRMRSDATAREQND